MRSRSIAQDVVERAHIDPRVPRWSRCRNRFEVDFRQRDLRAARLRRCRTPQSAPIDLTLRERP